MENCSLGC